MKLFERLEYLKADPQNLAVNFAEYMRHDDEANRSEICGELSAILQRRARLVAELEQIDLLSRCSAWEDFANIPGLPPPSKTAEQANRAAELERLGEAKRISIEEKAEILALDKLFCYICRALYLEGIRITSGEISTLKRYTMPQRLASALEEIKKEDFPTIPEAERLGVEATATLYKELMRLGLISGPTEAFAYYFGQRSTKIIKRPNTAVSWLGTDAQFAFFISLLSQYMQRDERGYITRIKAMCLAFGIDDRKRENVIRPYITDFRNGKRGSKEIKHIFEILPI